MSRPPYEVDYANFDEAAYCATLDELRQRRPITIPEPDQGLRLALLDEPTVGDLIAQLDASIEAGEGAIEAYEERLAIRYEHIDISREAMIGYAAGAPRRGRAGPPCHRAGLAAGMCAPGQHLQAEGGVMITCESPGIEAVCVVDRLRRDRNELVGELTVKCGLPDAKTVNGILSTGDFNFSSVRARQDRAKLLQQRVGTNGEFDWFSALEELAQYVFESERTGDPAVRLRDLPRPERGDDIAVDGLVFPRRHPSVLFGDGGAAKSLTALYVAGRLAQEGKTVLLADWELAGEDHRTALKACSGQTCRIGCSMSDARDH